MSNRKVFWLDIFDGLANVDGMFIRKKHSAYKPRSPVLGIIQPMHTEALYVRGPIIYQLPVCGVGRHPKGPPTTGRMFTG
mgnify:CR=1 FL=1